MPSKREAGLKHARYFADILLQADQLYQLGGIHNAEGLDLFDQNWLNIQNGQSHVAHNAATDADTRLLCAEYPERGSFCLFLRQTPEQRIQWMTAALDAAQKMGLKAAVGSILGKLGVAHTEKGEYELALLRFSQRLEIASQLEDMEGFAEGLCNLGIMYDKAGVPGNARTCYENALEYAKQLENAKITGTALGNLGLIHLEQGDFPRAREMFQSHLAYARQAGDPWAECNALINLGLVSKKQDRLQESVGLFQDALTISRNLRDRMAEGQALGHLASVHARLGNIQQARELYQQRIQVAVEVHDLRGEAIACWNLGEILLAADEYRAGISYLERCVDREIILGDPSADQDLKTLQELKKKHASDLS